MLRAVATQMQGAQISVRLIAAEEGAEENHEDAAHACEFPEKAKDGTPVLDEHGVAVCGKGPSPIAPEVKELAWTAGCFVLFALLMRFVLFPRLKKGMEARYNGIRADHEGADAARLSAQSEVAAYQAQLSGLKAEAAARVDAARQQLESERSAKLAEVNARIGERRSAAIAEADAAKAAVRDQIEAAVASVASRATELTLGQAPASSAVSEAVSSVMNVGAAR